MAEKTNQYTKDILLAFAERTVKRLWVLLILMTIYCGIITYLYVDAITQYETVEVTQEVDTGDGAAYVAGVGDVNYGESQAESQSTETENGR